MRVQALPGVTTREDLRAYLLAHGCYSQAENDRIYTRWFADAPRYLFRAVSEKYDLTGRPLCDVGCGYGMNLAFCSPTSYGIELQDYEVRFARSLGLTVFGRDVIHDDLSDLPRPEAAWCSSVLEHVDSPHILLRKLHGLLVPGGLLAVYVPTLPLLPELMHLPRVGRYFVGHTHSDQISAFVPATLRFACERAGFRTLEVSPFYPGPLRVLNRVPGANRIIDGAIYVGRAIAGWDYGGASTRRSADNARGFEYRGQPTPP